MYVVLQLSIALGAEEISWWQRSWEFVTGGTLGLLAGVAFFVIFGSIGWVCGPLFGAIGLFGLAFGGALGGLGLGALAHIIRDPSRYNFSWPTIIFVLLIGGILSKLVSSRVALFIERRLMQRNILDNSRNTEQVAGE